MYCLGSILGQGRRWWHARGLSRWNNNYQGTAHPIAVIKQIQYVAKSRKCRCQDCRQAVAKSSAITKLGGSSTSSLTSITLEEASPSFQTMSQWVKDKARLRFGKTVTNGLDDWFRHQHRLCPADLKGTKVKKFRKRHVQKWKSCKALTSKREKELMSSVFRHYNNCVILHTYIHYVCLYVCNLWHRMPPAGCWSLLRAILVEIFLSSFTASTSLKLCLQCFNQYRVP